MKKDIISQGLKAAFGMKDKVIGRLSVELERVKMDIQYEQDELLHTKGRLTDAIACGRAVDTITSYAEGIRKHDTKLQVLEGKAEAYQNARRIVTEKKFEMMISLDEAIELVGEDYEDAVVYLFEEDDLMEMPFKQFIRSWQKRCSETGYQAHALGLNLDGTERK